MIDPAALGKQPSSSSSLCDCDVTRPTQVESVHHILQHQAEQHADIPASHGQVRAWRRWSSKCGRSSSGITQACSWEQDAPLGERWGVFRLYLLPSRQQLVPNGIKRELESLMHQAGPAAVRGAGVRCSVVQRPWRKAKVVHHSGWHRKVGRIEDEDCCVWLILECESPGLDTVARRLSSQLGLLWPTSPLLMIEIALGDIEGVGSLLSTISKMGQVGCKGRGSCMGSNV